MGMVGWGKAFNLRFMPRTAPKLHVDSFWHRPYLPRGGSLFIKETTNVQIGPSGFWGFIIGLSQGLKGGGWFGTNNTWNMQTPAYVNPLATLNAAATQQGAKEPQTVEDKSLEQLNKLYGAKKFNIIERPAGKFTATDEKGKLVASNLSFDDMSEALSNYNNDVSSAVKPPEKKEPEKTEAQLKEEKAKEMGLTKSEDGKYMKDGKEYEWDGTTFKVKEDNSVVDDTDDAVVSGSKRKSRRTETVDGNKDSKLSDAKNKAGTYKADVCHFEFQNLHGFGKTQGQLYVEFVDGNGERQHFSAKVPRIYLDEASCKAALTDNVRQQIQSAGWKKVTFG